MSIFDRNSIARVMLAAVFAAAGSCCGFAQMHEQMTPVLLQVEDAPVPFAGTDGRTHLVYELWMANFSSGDTRIEKVEVLGDGNVIASLDASAIAQRMQPSGKRNAVDKLAASEQALLFLHVTLQRGTAMPQRLSHRVLIDAEAAPPGQQQITENGGATMVSHRTVALIAPPLRGDGYISADSCCDATRHTRAAMPINGRVWIAQRYAVDWEQMDEQGRIYNGPRERLASYTIFGKPVLAVADGMVVAVIDGLPEQTPGKFPTHISLEEADGNSVILDLGQQRYAMYAHMQPNSIKVHKGEQVKVGQVIGLVGNTGNSVAPHLHFQVMGGPSSLASNGLPYEIRSLEVVGTTPGTKAFDEAEEKGTPLTVAPMKPVRRVTGALPLDQLVISFAGR